jgi:primary-amine oxidase
MICALYFWQPANVCHVCDSIVLLVGDYGLGFCANSLELGCDCVGTIHYFDGLLSNATGGPSTDARSFAHPQACLTSSAAHCNSLIPNTSDFCALLFGCSHLYDVMAHATAGEPYVLKRAVCMHETDAGTLWKHTEYRTGHAEVVRSV